MKETTKNYLKTIRSRYREHYITAFSAQMAFFLFLSIFPFIMFIMLIASRLNFETTALFEIIMSNLPINTSHLIVNFINDYVINDSFSLLSISGLAAIWSASRGINALMRAFNMAYGYKETRNFVQLKFTGVFYTILIIISIIVTLALPSIGFGFFQFVNTYIPISSYFINSFYIIKILLNVCVYVFFILSIQKFLPAGRLKYRDIYIGGIFSIIGWYILSKIFEYFVSTFTNYATFYGGLASIVTLMMWMYFMSMLLMIGAEINSLIIYYRKNPEIKQ